MKLLLFICLFTVVSAVCSTGPAYNSCRREEDRRSDEEHARVMNRMRVATEATDRMIRETNQRREEAQRQAERARTEDYNQKAQQQAQHRMAQQKAQEASRFASEAYATGVSHQQALREQHDRHVRDVKSFEQMHKF